MAISKCSKYLENLGFLVNSSNAGSRRERSTRDEIHIARIVAELSSEPWERTSRIVQGFDGGVRSEDVVEKGLDQVQTFANRCIRIHRVC